MGFFLGCFGSGSRVKNDDRVCPARDSIDDDASPEQAGVKRYRWEELERYTMNFKEVIGVGGYSNVYLAKFPDSTLGAVKIYNSSERLNQVFKNELEISQKLHHDNIVKLLGYCDERDEGVLVFEYIPNGNLQEHLHHNSNSSNSNPKPTLTWQQRMTIAYQLAQSLSYLHSSELHVIHGDIKPSNILLDDNLNCNLCDLGCSKMGFSSMVTKSSSRSIPMVGSPGYVDPHFLTTGMASKKSDVYSFGVLLLEIVTGFEAVIYEGERHRLLTSVVRNKDGFNVDKVAEMAAASGSCGGCEEEVKAVAAIAGHCLHQLPSLRPSVEDVCRMMRDQVSCLSSLVVKPEKL